MNPYDIIFNICSGLFIGGIIFSIISLFLTEMETQSGGSKIDTDVDLEAEVDIDVDVEAEFDVETVDIKADMDVGVKVDTDIDVELDIDTDVDVNIDSEIDMDTDAIGITITPAPIMLLISAYILRYAMKFEKVYFKPVNDESYFERGIKVSIIDVKEDFLLVNVN